MGCSRYNLIQTRNEFKLEMKNLSGLCFWLLPVMQREEKDQVLLQLLIYH